jgi:Flp pilus assembly protein TadG
MRFPSPIRFLSDRRGNVAMMYALMLPVLIFGAGVAVDYTHAMQVQTKLDAAADAAVLAALTPAMMQQSDATAQTAATNLFNAMANAQNSLIAGNTQVTVNVCSPTACSPGQRTVTVTYHAANQNIFSGVLGASGIKITGTSSANASAAPNIDFYLLLDNSPSMALPATQDGINKMLALTTPNQTSDTSYTGCAFACHQAATNNGDSSGNTCNSGSTLIDLSGYTAGGSTLPSPSKYCTTTTSAKCSDGSSPTKATKSGKTTYYYCAIGQQIDDYQLAKNNNITLRIDELNTAVSTLMSTAQSTSNSSPQVPPPAYRFAAYSLDSTYAIGLTKLMDLTSNYVSGWAAASPNFQLMEVYSNNNVCKTSGTNPCGAAGGVGDVETDFDTTLNSSNMNSTTTMPSPGNGTNVAGDKPQGVLFIVTDGVVDETNSSTCTKTLTGSRCQEPITPSLCTAIKNRGIRIAVLYTTYLAVTNDGWYNTWISPFQPQISTQLQSCASPGLFYEATIGTDLGQALSNLFNTVTNSAHLTN